LLSFPEVEIDMRRLIIHFLLACCCLFAFSTAQALNDPASEIIYRVNALRAQYGVPAYQVDPILMAVAQAQASWSAVNNHMGHDGPGGSSPDDRAQAAGYGGGNRSFAIENVASGTASLNTPELVVTMWQGDWGHLNAMISPDYEDIGVGFAEANEFSWYVMMVGWVDESESSRNTASQETPAAYIPHVPFEINEPDENGATFHEVQIGQTAWTIAAKYGIELADLLELNNLTEDSVLHPGDKLLIRPPDLPTGVSATQQGNGTPFEIPTKPPIYPSQTTEVTPEPIQADSARDAAKTRGFTFVLITGLGIAALIISLIVFKPQKQ
jgi:LysM repeat protein